MQTPTAPAAAGKPAQTPVQRLLRPVLNLVDHARRVQRDKLATLQAMDAALVTHLTHGAMSGADPLTDILYAQIEACAEEGAQDPLPYSADHSAALAEAGLDPWLYWVMAVGGVAGVVLSACYPLGFAR